jgi:hypothetical protein
MLGHNKNMKTITGIILVAYSFSFAQGHLFLNLKTGSGYSHVATSITFFDIPDAELWNDKETYSYCPLDISISLGYAKNQFLEPEMGINAISYLIPWGNSRFFNRWLMFYNAGIRKQIASRKINCYLDGRIGISQIYGSGDNEVKQDYNIGIGVNIASGIRMSKHTYFELGLEYLLGVRKDHFSADSSDILWRDYTNPQNIIYVENYKAYSIVANFVYEITFRTIQSKAKNAQQGVQF